MSHKDFQKALNIKKSSKKRLAVLKSQNYATEIRGHYHESSDCFEYPNKITYLKKDTQKNACKMFLPQTTQAQKGPLIIPVTIRSTTPPPPHPSRVKLVSSLSKTRKPQNGLLAVTNVW